MYAMLLFATTAKKKEENLKSISITSRHHAEPGIDVIAV